MTKDYSRDDITYEQEDLSFTEQRPRGQGRAQRGHEYELAKRYSSISEHSATNQSQVESEDMSNYLSGFDKSGLEHLAGLEAGVDLDPTDEQGKLQEIYARYGSKTDKHDISQESRTAYSHYQSRSISDMNRSYDPQQTPQKASFNALAMESNDKVFNRSVAQTPGQRQDDDDDDDDDDESQISDFRK